MESLPFLWMTFIDITHTKFDDKTGKRKYQYEEKF